MSDRDPLSDRDLSRELRLFDRACCGDMEQGVGSELSELLRTSPGARSRYLRYTAMHADLYRKVRAARVRLKTALHFRPAGAQSRDEAQVTRPASGWMVPLMAMAIAASLAAMVFWPRAAQAPGSSAVAASQVEKTKPETTQDETALTAPDSSDWKWPGAVATIRRVENARWNEAGRAWRIEDYLTAGEAVEIAAGLVEVEFRQGAVVVLEGPARFVVESKNLASLHEGRMAAVVAPWAVGFRVNTPGLDVIDHGTEFAVSVGTPGDASQVNVVVTEGEVEVLQAADEAEGKRLRAGESVRSDGQATDEKEDAAARQLTKQLPKRPEIKNAEVIAYRWEDWPIGVEGQPRRAGAWRYYTNGRGPFGEPKLYDELIWDGQSKSYRPPRWRSGSESDKHVRVHREGGHPGKGSDQSEDRLDHYSITAYIVPEDGRYRIESGWLERPEPKRWDLDHVLDIAVNVNDGPLLVRKDCNRSCYATFSGSLGELRAGDVVYAGVGPSGVDHNDRFRWGFFIVREVDEAGL